MTVLAVLGDSAAHGVGDEVTKDVYRGFGHYLSQAMRGESTRYLNVSRPGARAAEVLDVQVEKAIAAGADIAVLVVGGNDVLRNDFTPAHIYRDVREAVLRLRGAGCEVVSMNLHDGSRVAPLPKSVGRVLRRRVEAVNCVYAALARDLSLAVLDVHRDERVYVRDMWHVDRMHPSRRGHQALAGMFAEMLRPLGYAVDEIPVDEHVPGRRRDAIRWLLVKGTPWCIKRCGDLLPSMVALSLISRLGLIDRVAPVVTVEMFSSPLHAEWERAVA